MPALHQLDQLVCALCMHDSVCVCVCERGREEGRREQGQRDFSTVIISYSFPPNFFSSSGLMLSFTAFSMYIHEHNFIWVFFQF